ncbi:MAG: T9SS type A sorting domain-containing protein, partial [Bacteroidota bacterium]
FFTGDQNNNLYLINNEGEIIKEISLQTDSTSFTPSLYSDGTSFILMGYEIPLPSSVQPNDLLNRHWKIQQYDSNGNLTLERMTQVNSQDIGLLFDRLSVGINVEVVLYNDLSAVGAVNGQYGIQIFNTIKFDPVTMDINEGPTLFYRYNRQLDSFESIVLDDSFNFITDMTVLDSVFYFYGIKGEAEELSEITNIHSFIDNISSFSSQFQPDIYTVQGLAIYSESDADHKYEVKASATSLIDPNMGDLFLSKKDSNGTIIATKNLATKRAPFGKNSLELGIDQSLFVLSADVASRSPLSLSLKKISKSTLETYWTFELPQEIYGLTQSIIPLENSCLVFGRRNTAQGEQLVVTKINEVNLNSTEHYNTSEDIILGPNPVIDYLHLSTSNQGNTLKIFNMNGALLKKYIINSDKVFLDIESGMYVIVVTDKFERVLESKKYIKL